MTKARAVGRFYGVGVGPGDPELITLKTLRLIKNAPVVSYLVNDQGQSQARNIAVEAFRDVRPGQLEVPIPMTMSTDRRFANQAYDQGAQAIRELLDQGQDVVFLCEGDPLFFGSFAYLLERLEGDYPISVVPGISSVNAASSALAQPLTMLKESFVVINGRAKDEKIRQALTDHDTVVIMKAGQARPRILSLLAETGRSGDAHYLEYIGRDNERILNSISELPNEVGPYFSLFVVIRKERDRG
ncbi:precorrin-2 C(20)-methyltransferase [Motiliproteus sp. MSK22-1]|uniref:precorrin-2 C(20)-methyltransferase n=1 Tax=Motiliproteus sp. MSK22-1 TaxID=1897630 RepID=UPI00097544D9|nr:precorrin-2 C(20)-methyltransferase [Motiliproteus sp. MSK22-1]OMH33556.1 precorrin-2 C(20)-methyltransferase [Motiliproteus sp. MSK22-1]